MIIKKIISRIAPKWVHVLWRKLTSETYSIITNPNEVFEKFYKVKDDTWENTYYPACYGHCKEQHLEVFIPAEYIYKIDNGIVSYESDVVLTDKGAYWEKFNEEEFVTWAIPADTNVTWYGHKNIGIKRYKKQEYIPGKTLAMVGVWAYHWGHCMYQFMPKLFSAGESGLLNEPVNILIVENEDATIMEIIHNYLAKFPNAKIIYAKPGIEYKCHELYYMPNPGASFNDPQFRLDYPYYISRHVLDKTKKYIIDPLIEKIKNNETKYEKIFLPRNGRNRNLTNFDEVHDYFKTLGFHDIEGAALTLEQKADLFYHAKEIVGCYGSAILNLMFCNQANAMVLINYKMSTDTSLYLQIRDYCRNVINVTGQDEKPEYHTDYYIPLEKIKKVYEECIKV
jgi:hypothetical protein